MMRTFATLTALEPPYNHQNWGNICIEVSKSGDIPCSSTVLSDIGIKEIENGGIVRFFQFDIGYRDLRPLFGEV